MDYDLIVVKTLERVYKNYYYIIRGENMKKLVKRSDVMQETLEAYCSCSCSCYGTCSCSTGQTNNSAALFQARYTQFYMDFVAIRMV